MKARTFVILCVLTALLAGVLLQAQGVVEIRAASSSAVAGWRRVTAAGGDAMWVAPASSLTSADIAGVEDEIEPNGRATVKVVFTAEGARKMRQLSAAQTNQRIAVLLDGKVMWAPVVRAAIESEAMLTGLSPEDALRLVTALQRQ